MPKAILYSLIFLMLVVSCECKDMKMRELPEEKEITFTGEVASPEAKKPYIPGDKREIKLHLGSNDEEAKDAKFKIVSWEVTNGKKGTLDVSSLQLGDNTLSYTPQEPGKHELTIKVAIEGEEENAQILHYTLEAEEANWQITGQAEGGGNITLTITDAPQEWHEKPWHITSLRWSCGLSGRIENIPTSLAYGTNNLQLTLGQVALAESPWVRLTIQGPDSTDREITTDLREECIEKLKEALSEEELQAIREHNEAVRQQEHTYQGNYAGTARADAQRELGALYDTTTRLQAETTTQLEHFVNNLGVLRNQNASGLTALDAKRTDLQRELAALASSIHILHPMVTRLRESNTGPIDPFGVLHEALQQRNYEETSMALHLESPWLEVNKEDDQGKTLLHLAIEQGNVPLSRTLIQKGAEVNVRDFSGKTPIQYAIDKNDQAAITLLRTSGADPDLPPDWQLQGSYDESSRQLVLSINNASERPQRERRQQEQWRITNVTWSHGIRGQIDPNLVLHHGQNRIPLTVEVATLTEQPSLQILVQGPDNAYQATALDLRGACVTQLTKKFFSENIEAEQWINNSQAVLGEDIEDTETARSDMCTTLATLLHQVTTFQKEYRKDLKKAEKSLNILNDTKLDIQLSNSIGSCEKLENTIKTLDQKIYVLKKGSIDSEALLFGALQNMDSETINTCLNSNIDVRAVDSQGKTLLHQAVLVNNVEAAKKLIEKGADVNAVAMQEQTALCFAARSNNIEMVKLLCASHGDLGIKSFRGTSLLQFAATGRSPEVLAFLIEKFREKRLDLGSSDLKGNTALHYLAKNTRKECSRMKDGPSWLKTLEIQKKNAENFIRL